MVLPQIPERARNHFAHGADEIRELLLAHVRDEQAARSLPRRGQLEQMPRDALRHRRERRIRELIPQRVDHARELLDHAPRDIGIALRERAERVRVHDETRRVGERLRVYRRRTARRGDEAEHIPRSGVADRDLPTVGRFEVDAEESADDERRARIGCSWPVCDNAGWDLFRRRPFEQVNERCPWEAREEAARDGIADPLIVDARRVSMRLEGRQQLPLRLALLVRATHQISHQLGVASQLGGQ
jgi:hypothetical protein